MDPSCPEKKPVPRFASFKPPVSQPERKRCSSRGRLEYTQQDETSKQKSLGHRFRHRQHRSQCEENRKSHHSRGEYIQHETSIIRESASVPEAALKHAGGNGADLFVVDTKGDKFNLVYGRIHRYSIPNYYRAGRGFVLGLPKDHKIDHNMVGSGDLVIRTEHRDSSSTHARPWAALSKLNKQKPRLLRLRPDLITDTTTADTAEDFLLLDISGRRGHQTALSAIDTDDENYAYRSVQGKAKPENNLPDYMEAVIETESSAEEGQRADADMETRRLNADLSRNAEENPLDVDAWLRLIDHQDAVLAGTKDRLRPLTYSEKMGLADIKISLCEKALRKSGQSASKDRLLLKLLEEGEKLWDTKKLSTRWQSVLKSNPQFISLWVRYLDFRQTEFLDFTYERCIAIFADCLRLNLSSTERYEKAHVQVYLFLRLTLFMREAGFTEHAVGLWQALFESIFFRPDNLGQDSEPQNLMPLFSEFWDSEVARIGDIGARGWKNNSFALEKMVRRSKLSLNPESIFASWAACERDRSSGARIPARSLDEVDDDEPYRVVLASDLAEFLPLMWNLNTTVGMIDSFLYFCHLPPIMSTANTETTGQWLGDNFLRNEGMENCWTTIDSWFSKPGADGLPATLFPHQNFIHSVDTFFAEQQAWFSSFQRWVDVAADNQSATDAGWARRCLRLLMEAHPENDSLAEYTLALEFAFDSKAAKKLAKSLLKKRPSCIRLYNSYALMEYRSGNDTAAEHVWATSISMSKTLMENDKTDAALLWQAWLWELLETGDTSRASYLLLAMPQRNIDLTLLAASDKVVFSPASLLKVRSLLLESQGSALGMQKSHVFVASTDCLALLSYLSNSRNLDETLGVYNATFNRLSAWRMQSEAFKSLTTQLLHQARARLLYYHMRNSRMYRPADIRTILAESMSCFPHNTIFLSLFAWNESRFRIEGHVRDIIKSATSRNHTVSTSVAMTQVIPITTHLFSIYTELSRPTYARSTLYSVRAAFERAIGGTDSRASMATIDSSTARSSLVIWKLYILFELSHNEVHRAKDVFYRGMRACPWSKELIMLAFTHLRADQYEGGEGERKTGMEFEELCRVYNVLIEKGLRVHIDIEHILRKTAKNTVAQGGPFLMQEDAEEEDS